MNVGDIQISYICADEDSSLLRCNTLPSLGNYRHVGEEYCLHLQGQVVQEFWFSLDYLTVTIEAVRTSETSVQSYQLTRCDIVEDLNLQGFC